MKSLYNNLKLSATIVSDTHIDIKHPHPEIPMFNLCRALKFAKKNSADAFITVGDTTSRGTETNWNLTRKCFKKINYDPRKIILTIGNHDCWSDGKDEYGTGIGLYYSACKDIMGRKLEKPYFTTVINSYSFICLGNESDMGCDADISDTQLDWLRSELQKATAEGKPAFVFCHQSLNARHGLPRTWDKKEDPNRDIKEGGIGEKSEEVAEILKSFKNVFYFSGHSHMGIAGEKMKKTEGYSTFESEDEVHLINLPSLSCGNHHGESNKFGIGMQLEVYDDRVVIRPYNFVLHIPMKNVKIKDGKTYYEIKL